MERVTIGKLLLTVILAGGSIMSFVLDWSPNHLLNPEWHGHARFHGALLLFLLAGVSATGVWLVWRRSLEPQVGVKVATLISLSFWTPLFYITSILPGSTAWAGPAGSIPHIGGIFVYPNLIVAAGFIGLTILGYWFASAEKRSSA
jgi:hypothetical protein